MYGWLRPLRKSELLGDFLTTRALTLTGMKRFEEAAEAWAQAATLLPQTSALNRIVQHARERAANEQTADRWDELMAEVTRLPVPSKPAFAPIRDRQLRVQRLMNLNTSLVVIEKAVADLKQEFDEVFKREALAADASRVAPPTQAQGAPQSALDPKAMELLATVTEAMPRRIRIPAERVPVEYWQGLPPALEERLRGLRTEEAIVSEINIFHAQEINRRNLAAMPASAGPPAKLPSGIRPEWLPTEYRETMPVELRNRLAHAGGKAQAEWTVRQYETEQTARHQAEVMTRNGARLPLTGSPILIENITMLKGN